MSYDPKCLRADPSCIISERNSVHGTRFRAPRAIANNRAEVPALLAHCKTSDFAKAPQVMTPGRSCRPHEESTNALPRGERNQEIFMRHHPDCETDQFFACPAWSGGLNRVRAARQPVRLRWLQPVWALCLHTAAALRAPVHGAVRTPGS